MKLKSTIVMLLVLAVVASNFTQASATPGPTPPEFVEYERPSSIQDSVRLREARESSTDLDFQERSGAPVLLDLPISTAGQQDLERQDVADYRLFHVAAPSHLTPDLALTEIGYGTVDLRAARIRVHLAPAVLAAKGLVASPDSQFMLLLTGDAVEGFAMVSRVPPTGSEVRWVAADVPARAANSQSAPRTPLQEVVAEEQGGDVRLQLVAKPDETSSDTPTARAPNPAATCNNTNYTPVGWVFQGNSNRLTRVGSARTLSRTTASLTYSTASQTDVKGVIGVTLPGGGASVTSYRTLSTSSGASGTWDVANDRKRVFQTQTRFRIYNLECFIFETGTYFLDAKQYAEPWQWTGGDNMIVGGGFTCNNTYKVTKTQTTFTVSNNSTRTWGASLNIEFYGLNPAGRTEYKESLSVMVRYTKDAGVGTYALCGKGDFVTNGVPTREVNP